MNKKFSTLLTFGLLVGGSLVSVANAAGETKLPLGNPISVFKNGTYFVVQDEDNSNDASASDIVMGFSKGATDAEITANATKALASVDTDLGVVFESGDTEKNYIWKVTQTKAGKADAYTYTYTFENLGTGKKLTLQSDKATLLTDYSDINGTFSTFACANDMKAPYSLGTVFTINGATEATGGLKLADKSITFSDAQDGGGKFILYSIAPTSVTASNLNNAAKGAFTLKYDKSTNNPFAGALKAFNVDTRKVTGSTEGVYFATSWPKSLDEKDVIDNLADFKSCTFIAADPKSNYKINDLNIDAGEGFGFVNVKGSMLLTTPDLTAIKKGYVLSNNAAFSVELEYNRLSIVIDRR